MFIGMNIPGLWMIHVMSNQSQRIPHFWTLIQRENRKKGTDSDDSANFKTRSNISYVYIIAHTSYIYIYNSSWVNIYIYIYISLKGRGHHFVAIKRGVVETTYRMIGFHGLLVLTKWWGRVHQPPLFNTPSILYGGILSPEVRSCFFLEHEFCLPSWTLCPKKGTIL